MARLTIYDALADTTPGVTSVWAKLLREIAWFSRLLVLFPLAWTLGAAAPSAPEAWVPVRWTGGPLELAWRAKTNTLPTDPVVRETLAHWYEPATLALLDGSAANCLLVTWSAPSEAAAQAEQQQQIKVYTQAAHKRGLAVLGLVYAPGDAAKIAAEGRQAGLDGLVLEGEFSPAFSSDLRKAAGTGVVVEVVKDAASWRWKQSPIVALAGVAPNARNLADMGIRGTPSSQPWIQSNMWLVRSFRLAMPARAVWISSQLEKGSEIDYERAVADAAAAGGHWIVSLDDALRAKLRARDTSALAVWQRILLYQKFAENHATWRDLPPFGNVGMVLDVESPEKGLADEYLSLASRRQVPYRLVQRSELNASVAAQFRALVATGLDPLSTTERKVLQDFAESGGVVLVGPSWGGAPVKGPSIEVTTGKGRAIVYKDPDPETVARDLQQLLADEELGVVPFNVPSVITMASAGGSGNPLVVQLVNYFDHPVERITLRVARTVHSAHLETPGGEAVELPRQEGEGSTEVTIPKLLLWGTVLME